MEGPDAINRGRAPLKASMRGIVGVLLDRWPAGSFERCVFTLELLPEALGHGWQGAPDPKVIGLLVPLLDDPSSGLRRRAMDALARVLQGTGPEGLSVVKALDDHARVQDGFPLLRGACMSSTPWDERLAVAWSDLHHPSPARRLAALRGLATWPTDASPEAWKAAMAALRPSDDIAHRSMALECCGTLAANLPSFDGVAALESEMETSWVQRAHAAGYCPEVAVALAAAGRPEERSLRDRRVVPLLTAAGASQRRAAERLAGLRALAAGTCPDPDHLALACRLVSDPIRHVRWQALWTLAEASRRWPAAEWSAMTETGTREDWRRALLNLVAPAPGTDRAVLPLRYRLLGEACQESLSDDLGERLLRAAGQRAVGAEATVGWGVLHMGEGSDAIQTLASASPVRPGPPVRVARGAAIGLILRGGDMDAAVGHLGDDLVGPDASGRGGAALGLLAAAAEGANPWTTPPHAALAPWTGYVGSCARIRRFSETP